MDESSQMHLDYVLFRHLPMTEQVRPSGIILPTGEEPVHPANGEKRAFHRFEVVDAGPGAPVEPYQLDAAGEPVRKKMTARVGDIVVLKGAGSLIATLLNGEMLGIGHDWMIAQTVGRVIEVPFRPADEPSFVVN